MSMMENPNLMDAASFGGPQSPIGEWNNSMIMSHLDRIEMALGKIRAVG